MKSTIDRKYPIYDPNKDRRNGKPAATNDNQLGRHNERSAPVVQHEGNKTQPQQEWQTPDISQQLTNHDEQRKITNAENSDDVIEEGGS